MNFTQAVIDEIKQGKKIQAIKLFREENGVGLKEAKIAVETYITTHPEIKEAFESNTSQGLSQERLLQIVILVVAIAVVMLMVR